MPPPNSEYEPAGHGEHDAWLTVSVNVPATQLTQTALDVDVHACKYLPAEHERVALQAEHVGFTPPTDAKKVPLVHTHAVKAALDTEFGLQFVQLGADCAEKVLTRHCVQDDVVPLPAVEYEPAGHGEHDAWLTASVYDPARQLTQTALVVDVQTCR